MIQLNNNPIAVPADMTRAEMREAIKEAGYSDEQFQKYLITVCSYAIAIGMQMMYEQVKADCDELRKHPLCTRQGYKMELKKVEAENQRLHQLQQFMVRDDRERIEIIAREQQAYMDTPLTMQQLFYAIQNHLNRNFIRESKLLSYSIHAQTIADFVKGAVETRLDEAAKVKPAYKDYLSRIVPHKLNQYLCDLSARIAHITGNDTSDEGGTDINQCHAISVCLHKLDNGILDLENLETNTAFALQEIHGDQWLHDNDLGAWELLHPTQSRAYKAQKEREAAQAEADRLERERIDRELAEAEAARRAEEERDIADRLRDAGWNIKKR